MSKVKLRAVVFAARHCPDIAVLVGQGVDFRGQSSRDAAKMVAANVANDRRVQPAALKGEDVRFAALVIALFTVFVGIGGLISPERGTEIRRLYFATPERFYTAGAVRVAMGLVVILSAPTSRAPKTLRALGAVMCMQGLAATLMGPDRARAIMEWETMRGTALLRVGAAVALAAGVFLAFAVTGHRPQSGPK
jgi:hypothetical protein